jgi:hypothetical protein
MVPTTEREQTLERVVQKAAQRDVIKENMKRERAAPLRKRIVRLKNKIRAKLQ